MDKQTHVLFRGIIPFIILFFSCCTPHLFAATSTTGMKGKIGPFLKGDIVQGQTNKESAIDDGSEFQNSTKDEKTIKVIVVIDADYLQPLADNVLRELKRRVEKLGGHLGNHAFNNVQVWIPPGKVEALASWTRIKLIKKPTRPRVDDVAGSRLQRVGVTEWHSAGITGRGVKVGIIDAGFSGYADLLGTELPLQVETKYNGFWSDFISSRHGTACAEIIHDLAPDATLYLVNVADISVDFVNAVKWLQSQGVTIISSSIGLNLKLFCKLTYEMVWGDADTSAGANELITYVDGVETQWNATISAAVANGITWSQAAGNDAQKKWSGPFVDNDGNNFLNFSPAENWNEIVTTSYADEDVYVLLLWDGDEMGHYHDYDLYIVDQNEHLKASSQLDQSQVPLGVEACKFKVLPGSDYYIAIKDFSPRHDYHGNLVLLVGHEQFPKLEYYDPYGTVNLNCPASNPDVITVGAALLDSSLEVSIESYSSQGPAGDIVKPDLVAPDGIITASYSQRFDGTSAAAPFVAGIAALVAQYFPGFSPREIKNYLEANALDLGPGGKDTVYGSGLVHLPADFACQQGNLEGCKTASGCNGIGAFWYGESCSLEPRREVCDYDGNRVSAPVRLGDDAVDGEISPGDKLSLVADFPLVGETRNYAMIQFPDDIYFIHSPEQPLTKDFVPIENGTFFENLDICPLPSIYQGEWDIYFLSVPIEAGNFQTLETLSDYLASDDGQYVFGHYSIMVDCH